MRTHEDEHQRHARWVGEILNQGEAGLRATLRAVLLDVETDPEQCPACDAVNEPCPWHQGADAAWCAAARSLGAYLTRLGNDDTARESFIAQGVYRD